MKTLYAFVIWFALCLLLSPVTAQEKIVQGTPTTFSTPPTLTGYIPVTISVTRNVSGYTTASQIAALLAPADTNGNPIAGTPIVISYPDATVTALDTEAEVAALINGFKSANLSTAFTGAGTGNLWQRILFFACLDFASKFPGGCTVS